MTSINRWDPFNDMMSLRDAMNSLIEESVVRPTARSYATGNRAIAIPVDLYETNNEYVLTASLPGIKPEDININITGEVLTLSAETRQETGNEQPVEGQQQGKEGQQNHKANRRNYIYRETRYGSFVRQLSLPGLVQADKAVANFEHGVLKLTLPKVEESKPKQIKVQVSSGTSNPQIDSTTKQTH